MSERYDIEENFKDIFWNGYINETFKICELRKMNSYIQRIYGVFNMPRVEELVKNISKETMDKYGDIEWNMIKGLRNRIVHDYEGISLKSIWYVIENDLIELKEKIQNILDKEKNNS